MTKKRILKSIFYAVVAAVLCVVTVICGQAKLSAFADTMDGVRAAYENTNVLDNLQGSTLGGNAFNLEDYPHKENGKPQIISFVEFCYSYYSEKQSDFGLYVYVYNPQDLAFDTNTERNKIQFKYGTSNYSTYPLEFLNYSKAAGYEGRFFKFKIALTDTQRRSVLNTVKANERVYEVSGITLSVKSVVTEYTCAQKYTYTGFVKGYGSELAESDTLSCTVDGFDKYLELDVKHTVYRPQGDFYEGKQAQLNSCYFRVPEKFFTDYGNLSKIACEWYEYVTQPMLVTQDWYLYQRLHELSGGDVSNFVQNMYFLVLPVGNRDEATLAPDKLYTLGIFTNYENFNNEYTLLFNDGIKSFVIRDFDKYPRFDKFAAVFYSGADTSYKDRYVTSEEIQSQLIANSEKLGAPYLTERYSEALFSDNVNEGHIRGENKKEIPADYKHDVFWSLTTKSLWQTLFGGYDVATVHDALEAIITVESKDLTGTNAEISKNLRVAEGDVSAIKSEYDKAVANGERLVLFRFGQSDYYSFPVATSYCSKSTDKADEYLLREVHKQINNGYTGYMSQETVYLDFDIISLWFTADNVETEIPVVASPVDVISSLFPPLDENYHNQGKKSAFIVVLAAILVLMLVVGILVVWKIIFPPKLKINVSDKQRK